jgi:hypothetical protein
MMNQTRLVAIKTGLPWIILVAASMSSASALHAAAGAVSLHVWAAPVSSSPRGEGLEGEGEGCSTTITSSIDPGVDASSGKLANSPWCR